MISYSLRAKFMCLMVEKLWGSGGRGDAEGAVGVAAVLVVFGDDEDVDRLAAVGKRRL